MIGANIFFYWADEGNFCCYLLGFALRNAHTTSVSLVILALFVVDFRALIIVFLLF